MALSVENGTVELDLSEEHEQHDLAAIIDKVAKVCL